MKENHFLLIIRFVFFQIFLFSVKIHKKLKDSLVKTAKSTKRTKLQTFKTRFLFPILFMFFANLLRALN